MNSVVKLMDFAGKKKKKKAAKGAKGLIDFGAKNIWEEYYIDGLGE